MISTTRVTFTEIPSYREVRKKCCSCNGWIRKRLRQFQTINPWNQKTSSEIRSENEVRLDADEKVWVSQSEKCPPCAKQAVPDIELDFITKDEWDSSVDLRTSISSLRAELHEKERQLQELVRDRHLAVIQKGKARIGQVEQYCPYRGFCYRLVRKDMKDVTDICDSIQPDEAFK